MTHERGPRAGGRLRARCPRARRGGRRARAPRDVRRVRTRSSPSSAGCCRPSPRACRSSSRRPALRARIMAAAAADLAARRQGAAPRRAATDDAVRPPSRRAAVRPRPSRSRTERARARRAPDGLDRHLVAAHRRGLRDRRARRAGACSSGQLERRAAVPGRGRAVLEVAAQPGSLTAILTRRTAATGSGLAAVSASGEVTIAMQALAPTTGSQVYEAWVIAGDGGPGPGRQLHRRQRRDRRVRGIRPADRGPARPRPDARAGPGATTPTMPIISKGVATGAG